MAHKRSVGRRRIREPRIPDLSKTLDLNIGAMEAEQNRQLGASESRRSQQVNASEGKRAKQLGAANRMVGNRRSR